MVEARRTLRPVRFFTNDRTALISCNPTALPLHSGDVELRYSGILLGYFDLSLLKAAGMQRLQKELLLLFVGILVIGAGLSVSLHFLVTARLRRVVAAIDSFAAGQLVEPRKMRIPDEIGILRDQFDEMAFTVGRSERLFQAIVRDQTEMIVRWKPDGTRTFVNDAYCRIFGGTREDYIGTSFLPLVSEEYREAVRRKIAAISPQNPVVTGIHKSLPSDGGTAWQEWTDRGIFDADGKLVELQSTGRDITERVEAEEQIRRLNTDLEKRVEERTAELIAANKELEAFSYSVSHDLRTPLRNVSGFIGLLRAELGEVTPDQARYIETITREARRMGQLIDDLLSFSRIGRTELRSVQVNLNELIAEVRESLTTEVGTRDILWNIDALPVVEADLGLTRQILANLLGNAVKYTRKCSRAEIHVGVAPSDERNVIFFVKDNGVGFDMKYADRLFGAFQRLHSPKEFEGTGIGLANVHRIVQRHGGRIWAEAQVGRGATFFVSLPRSVT
jgi:PAS domain S-box-containing protein